MKSYSLAKQVLKHGFTAKENFLFQKRFINLKILDHLLLLNKWPPFSIWHLIFHRILD